MDANYHDDLAKDYGITQFPAAALFYSDEETPRFVTTKMTNITDWLDISLPEAEIYGEGDPDYTIIVQDKKDATVVIRTEAAQTRYAIEEQAHWLRSEIEQQNILIEDLTQQIKKMMQETENDKIVYAIVGCIFGFVFGYKFLSQRMESAKPKTS